MARFGSLADLAACFDGSPEPTGDDGVKVLCPTHADQRPSLHLSVKGGKLLVHCLAGCPVEGVLEAKDIALRDLFLENGNGEAPARPKGRAALPGKKKPGKIVQTYPYKDETGTLLYEAVRFEPKDFVRRRPTGKGGWIWNLDGIPRRVVYRLPELMAAP